MPLSQRHVAAAAWGVAFVLLVAGYARIELHEIRQARSAEAEAIGLRARVDRSRAIVRNRVALLAARKNIVADIGEQASGVADSDFGSLLASLDRSARRSGLTIQAVEPDGGVGDPSKDGWLRSRTVRLVVRGSYAHFLRFLPDLSNTDPLIQVQDVAIAPADRAQGRPLLSFTLGVAAYTVRIPASKE